MSPNLENALNWSFKLVAPLAGVGETEPSLAGVVAGAGEAAVPFAAGFGLMLHFSISLTGAAAAGAGELDAGFGASAISYKIYEINMKKIIEQLRRIFTILIN